MKLQIDFENKTIKIEEKVNLNELFEKLNIILPNGLWKEYSIEMVTITNWVSPIVIKEPYYIPTNPWPWWQAPTICYDSKLSTDVTISVPSVFNVSNSDNNITKSKYDMNDSITNSIYNIEI